jgi:uncharacterized protein (DUF302 family)
MNGDDDLLTIPSRFSVHETMDRLATVASGKGMNIFLRMDHAANAREIGVNLRPTELIVFGNPKGESPVTLLSRRGGVDLPVKAVAWQDDNGDTWLGYNSAGWLKRHYGLADRAGAEATLKAIETDVAVLCRAAAGTD